MFEIFTIQVSSIFTKSIKLLRNIDSIIYICKICVYIFTRFESFLFMKFYWRHYALLCCFNNKFEIYIKKYFQIDNKKQGENISNIFNFQLCIWERLIYFYKLFTKLDCNINKKHIINLMKKKSIFGKMNCYCRAIFCVSSSILKFSI